MGREGGEGGRPHVEQRTQRAVDTQTPWKPNGSRTWSAWTRRALRLIKRVFEIDMEHCPNDGGELEQTLCADNIGFNLHMPGGAHDRGQRIGQPDCEAAQEQQSE